jgi:myosin heavy subunit
MVDNMAFSIITAFVEKNKDVLFKDLIAVMQSSDVLFIVNLFPDDISVWYIESLHESGHLRTT